MSYAVLPHYPLPKKSKNLQQRAEDAKERMPQNLAHQQQFASVVDWSQKARMLSDDMIHGMVKSRSHPDHPLNIWNAELAVMPQHTPTQRPHNIAFERIDQRQAYFNLVSPVQNIS